MIKNISNYENLLEQQLFFDKKDPLALIDSTPGSNIMMSNLSHNDNTIPKSSFEFKNVQKENQQKSDSQPQPKLN